MIRVLRLAVWVDEYDPFMAVHNDGVAALKMVEKPRDTRNGWDSATSGQDRRMARPTACLRDDSGDVPVVYRD
jgi:hypothetical protein